MTNLARPRQVFRSLLVLAAALPLITGRIALGAEAESGGLERLLAGHPRERIADSWIVTLVPGVAADDVLTIAGRHGGSAGGFFAAVPGFVFRGSDAAAVALARDPSVEAVEPNVAVAAADKVIQKTTAGDRRTRSRHPDEIDAHDLGFKGQGARVAIIDTGVDLDHPEFQGRISDGATCTDSGNPSTGGNAGDTAGDGHGTRVAGVAAAGGVKIFGVAPRATIVPIRVTSKAGIICAANYVTDLNTDGDNGNDVDVANISLVFGEPGSPRDCRSSALHRAICRSVDAGTLYTAAAGNAGRGAGGTAPAKYAQVLAASAMTDVRKLGEPGPRQDGLASFSNFGGVIDLMGPGTSVFSSTIDGYTTRDGTSYAAPTLAGALAVLIGGGRNPSKAANDLRKGGECPNGTPNADGGTCAGQGQWPRIRYTDGEVIGDDPDNNPEPFLNVVGALTAAGLTP